MWLLAILFAVLGAAYAAYRWRMAVMARQRSLLRRERQRERTAEWEKMLAERERGTE